MNSMFTKIVRLLLGLILLISGINRLLPTPFIPVPDLPDVAKNFMTSLGDTGYVLPFLGVLEISIAAMLLLKKWVAFALIVLVPISINILLFHLFLDIPGVSLAFLVAILNGVLIYKHWQQYKSLFY